ncbi:hypothetical protein LZ30DRAFT_574713, partial [Colletotrichum cereale]
PPRQRRQRTRTGCLKCRVRRRKCDERKPRCQRCIDGDFECQYGSRLTFLDKNALTVSPTPNAGETSTPRYSRLQFVNPGSPNRTAKASSPPSPESKRLPNTTIATDATDTPACLSPSRTPAPTFSSFPIDPQLSDPAALKPPPMESSLAPSSHHPPPLTQWRSQSIGSVGHESLALPVGRLHITEKPPGRSPNDDAAYETALNVLLSLGNEGTEWEPSPDHGSGPYAVAGDGFGVSPHELMPASPNSAKDRRASVATHPLTTASVPPDRLLKLLRHFRYQVAPWLDLCDMGQTFGLYAPRLAMESEGVLHSLLAVAAVAQQADMGSTTFNDVEYLRSLAGARPMSEEVVSMGDSNLVHLALWTACRFTSSIPDGWHDLAGTMGDDFWSVALAEATTKTIIILSVLIRFELAAALVTGAPISVPEQLHYDPMPRPWDSSSPIAETMFQCTVAPLILCARAVNFCAGGFHPHAAGLGIASTPVHRWTVLGDALGAWYANRTQEFRPMAEMDGDESLFPVVLFTNGAAVFANQLYHTAMLLLLQNKPRTLQPAPAAAKRSSAASSSPLWHAQRVCGIALNNDRRDSWDLCLVASLYLAAQRMTYEPQQRAILECFERVKALTGWNVDGFSARARQDWGMDVG